jgi:hypothetical protein
MTECDKIDIFNLLETRNCIAHPMVPYACPRIFHTCVAGTRRSFIVPDIYSIWQRSLSNSCLAAGCANSWENGLTRNVFFWSIRMHDIYLNDSNGGSIAQLSSLPSPHQSNVTIHCADPWQRTTDKRSILVDCVFHRYECRKVHRAEH